jgi:hypothetical protein
MNSYRDYKMKKKGSLSKGDSSPRFLDSGGRGLNNGQYLIYELQHDFPKYAEFYNVKGAYFYIKATNCNFPAYIVSNNTTTQFDFFINFVELPQCDRDEKSIEKIVQNRSKSQTQTTSKTERRLLELLRKPTEDLFDQQKRGNFIQVHPPQNALCDI